MDQNLTFEKALSYNREVRHSNVLTTSRFEYSQQQLDLFFFILSKLRASDDDLVYQLNIAELSKLTGRKYDLAYLWKGSEGMMGRVFSTAMAAKNPEHIAMFQRIRFLTGTGIIEFELTRHIVPHLFDLAERFTSFGLQAALKLTSKYAKKIYTLCSQWKDLGETKPYTLHELKFILELIDEKGENEKHPAFKDFRKIVLDVAVKQINEHTELRIGYKAKKMGRSYQNIIFTVELQDIRTNPPFDLAAIATTPTLPDGITQHHYDLAVKTLDEVGIKDSKNRQAVLNNPERIAKTVAFRYQLQTGKLKVTSSAAGLLLKITGLLADKTKPKST